MLLTKSKPHHSTNTCQQLACHMAFNPGPAALLLTNDLTDGQSERVNVWEVRPVEVPHMKSLS